MAKELAVSKEGSSSSLKEKSAIPRLYLSSLEAGWEGLKAKAFHEPAEVESLMTPVRGDISLILFKGGTMRFGKRHLHGSWKELYLRERDMILRPDMGISYEVRWKCLSSTPTQTLHLHLSKELITRTAEDVTGYDSSRICLVERAGFQDTLLSQIGMVLWQELEGGTPIGKIYAQSAACLLAVHLLRHYTSLGKAIKEPSQLSQRGLTRQQIKRVIDFVEAHICQDLSLEDLALQTGFSPYHFARLFRQTTGESPHQFVLRQRIERAQRLLTEKDMSLVQAALECGFANQSHFTQVFKRHVGITPRAYRQDRILCAGF